MSIQEMENFILYEEIGKGTNSIVYKGRRKGTIRFLSILCIDKEKRAAVTNWVRLVHEIDHVNVVKFHEWYETTNHLWMVTELCTGGTLEELLKQDIALPQKTICSFGRNILLGLHYLHEHGIVFSDLSPKKVLLDGPGVLKLTNFCLSRLQDENLHDVFLQAGGQLTDNFLDELKGRIEYQAPEVLSNNDVSTASDIWSFGVLMYRLYAGDVPFKYNNLADLLQKVNHLEYDDPQAKRSQVLGESADGDEITAEFTSLITLLLNKDPEDRPTTTELLDHAFWRLVDHVVPDEIIADPIATAHAIDIKTNESGKGDASSGVEVVKQTVETVVVNDSGDGAHVIEMDAPESVMDSTFTLSSRPHTAQKHDEFSSIDVPLNKTTKGINESANRQSMGETFTVDESKDQEPTASIQKRPGSSVLSLTGSKKELLVSSLSNLVYHGSDIEVEIIQDNTNVRKVEAPRWDAKLLPFRGLTSLDGITPDELYSHMKQILQTLNQSGNSSQTRVKASVTSYLSHLATLSSAVSNYVVNSPLLPTLANLIKITIQQSPDVACRAARCIGLVATFATELEQCTSIGEVFSALCDIMRENFRNLRSKLYLVPAAGQLLYFVAEQEQGIYNDDSDEKRPQSNNKGTWSVPTTLYTLITRCLREGEDTAVQHYACKIIQSVCHVSPYHGKRFALTGSSTAPASHSTDVIGPILWNVSERSPSEALKHSALSAIMCLNKLSGTGSILQSVLDRNGLPNFFSVLGRASYKCQQSILTSFVETLASTPKGQAVRIVNTKDIVTFVLKLFDSPSAVVRGKVVLCILLLLKKKPTLLLTACNHRLIMYIERDYRRISTPSSATHVSKQSGNLEYIHSCINTLISFMAQQVPSILQACSSILSESINRKHPSSNQVKQLRAILPTCQVLYHMISSQIFRTQIVNANFIDTLGKLLGFVTHFISKKSSFMTAVGDEAIQKFNDSILSSVECLAQHPLFLANHEESSMTSLIPQLINLLIAYNSNDGQMASIKLLNDALSSILKFNAFNNDNSLYISAPPKSASSQSSARSSARPGSRRAELPDICGMQGVITKKLFPELKSALQGKEPLPAYSVRLLGTVLEHWPSLCQAVYSSGLLSILVSMFDALKASPYKASFQQLVCVFSILFRYSNERFVSSILNSNFIDNVLQCITETYCQYSESKQSQSVEQTSACGELLLHCLNLLKSMLDHVTTAVKNALQTQSSVSSVKSNQTQTDDAEQLLVVNKPLTELQGICIQLLCDDIELFEPSLACISLLVQLYGGDHPDTLSIENMNILAQTLLQCSPKSQRIILKLIKRIVSLNDYHAEQISSEEGMVLLNAIQTLLTESQNMGESNISGIASDIFHVLNR